MLEVKLNEVKSITTNASVDKSMTRVFKGMLRTVHGYTKDQAETVYIYARISDNHSVTFSPMFKINGKIYEMSTLKNAHVKDEKTGETIDFDFDMERQLSLHKYLGADLLNDVIPALNRANSQFPDELWISYEIASDLCNIEVSYLDALDSRRNLENSEVKSENLEVQKAFPKTINETVKKWIEELEDPEKKMIINTYDYPDFLSEDFMLELELLD